MSLGWACSRSFGSCARSDAVNPRHVVERVFRTVSPNACNARSMTGSGTGPPDTSTNSAFGSAFNALRQVSQFFRPYRTMPAFPFIEAAHPGATSRYTSKTCVRVNAITCVPRGGHSELAIPTGSDVTPEGHAGSCRTVPRNGSRPSWSMASLPHGGRRISLIRSAEHLEPLRLLAGKPDQLCDIGLVGIRRARRRIEPLRDAGPGQWSRDIIRVVFHLAHHTVGQHRHPPDRGNKQQDHHCQFHLPDRGRLNLVRDQKLAEHVQPRSLHRVGDQRLAAKI